SSETRFTIRQSIRNAGIHSGLSVVIGGLKEPFGVLVAYSTQRRKFTRDDISFIQSIANILGQAVERMAGDEALRSSERYYRSLIDNSSDIVTVVAGDGTVLFNGGSTWMLASRFARAIGKTGWDYVHPNDRERCQRALQEALEHGSTVYECRIKSGDGKW